MNQAAGSQARQSESAVPDKLALRLWLRLLACETHVEKMLRARLASEFATTLPRFDVLAALERAPDGLQLTALSRRLRVSNGNVTVVVARLAADGLIERRVLPADGRVVQVSLTEKGRAAFLAMARAHEGWIEEMFAGLELGEQAQAFALLGRLRSSLPGYGARP